MLTPRALLSKRGRVHMSGPAVASGARALFSLLSPEEPRPTSAGCPGLAAWPGGLLVTCPVVGMTSASALGWRVESGWELAQPSQFSLGSLPDGDRGLLPCVGGTWRL